MPRILLIGMPNRPHSADVISSLLARGYTVVTADTVRNPCFSDLVEASLPVASLMPDDVVPVASSYHRRAPFDGVPRFHELAVPASNAVAVALGLSHFQPDRIEGCVNKLRMRQWMRERGVTCPDFGEASSETEARLVAHRIGFPVVIKPQSGGAGYGVTRLDDDKDVARFFEHIEIFWEPRRFIVERYVDGPELSVETVTTDRPVHVAVFEKPQPLVGPYFLEHTFITPGRYDRDTIDTAYAAVDELIESLGLRQCVTHTELRIGPDGPFVVEFGLRPIGYPGPVCVAHSAGVDLLEIMAQLACAEQPSIAPAIARSYCGWRYVTVPADGLVEAIRGLDEARNAPGVLSCTVWAELGERLALPPRGFNYIKGHIVAEGDTFERVRERLAMASSLVRIEVAPER